MRVWRILRPTCRWSSTTLANITRQSRPSFSAQPCWIDISQKGCINLNRKWFITWVRRRWAATRSRVHNIGYISSIYDCLLSCFSSPIVRLFFVQVVFLWVSIVVGWFCGGCRFVLFFCWIELQWLNEFFYLLASFRFTFASRFFLLLIRHVVVLDSFFLFFIR